MMGLMEMKMILKKMRREGEMIMLIEVFEIEVKKNVLKESEDENEREEEKNKYRILKMKIRLENG